MASPVESKFLMAKEAMAFKLGTVQDFLSEFGMKLISSGKIIIFPLYSIITTMCPIFVRSVDKFVRSGEDVTL